MTKPLLRLAAVLVTMVAAASGALTFDSIYSFPADTANGRYPNATLTVGPDGNLYGTTTQGGSNDSGTAFRMTTGGSFSVLGHFERSTTGLSPTARLINIGDGFLYGATTANSGAVGVNYGGTVFKLNPAGGEGSLSVVFNLPGDGIGPKKPVALVSGEPNVLHVLAYAPGGVWRIPLDGGTRTIASQFPGSGDEGIGPYNLVRGLDGKFYGTTEGTTYQEGQPGRRGTLFRVDADGSNRTNLYDFHYDTSGAKPIAAMALDPSTGVFYGVTYAGGEFGDGVFFRFDPASHVPGTLDTGLTVKHLDDVPASVGDLLLASDGKIYGTCSNLNGSIWRINKDGSGFERFDVFNGTNGRVPLGGLVQAPDGLLYGTTSAGGAGNNGTIFRIDLGLPPAPVNRPPVAIIDYKNSSGTGVFVQVLANDFDPNEDPNTDEIEEPLTVSIETQAQKGAASLEVGGQILYTPGATYAGYDEFTYRVTDPDGLYAIGTVVITDDPIPEPWQAGVYNGLLYLDPALQFNADTPRGQLIINVTDSGIFTGRLFTGGKRLTVRGFFDEDGSGFGFVKIPKKGTAIIFLAAGNGGALSAYFFGQEQWTGALNRVPVENPPPAARYTIALLPDDAGMPLGNGYGAGRMLSNGVFVMVGKLGDGSKLAWGSTIVLTGGNFAIPVFNEPVKGGVCAGYFFAIGGNPTFQGELRWIRPQANKPTHPYPAGFSGEAIGLLDIYTPPARGAIPIDFGPDGSGGVGIGGVPAGFSAEGGITVDGSRMIPADPLRAFSISRGTGLFSGKIKDPNTSRTYSFKGAVLQSLGIGFGHYSVEKETGATYFVAEGAL